jgi:NADH:ubiquinone oxidoreductase subunit E
VCDGESCRQAGSAGLLGLLRSVTRLAHPARRDVRVSSSRCLGHCSLAPAMVEDGRLLGWVSLRRLKIELERLGLTAPADSGNRAGSSASKRMKER